MTGIPMHRAAVRRTLRGGLALLAGALALAAGCAGGPSEGHCSLVCGNHGQCVIIRGHEECLCDAGYGGATCAECGAGYVLEGSDCVVDPCDPNPCHDPHKGVCQVVAGAAACTCDLDAQDNDGNGTCRPTCEEAVEGHGPQACDDSSGEAVFVGPRTCDTVIRVDPGDETFDELFVRGEFNGWAPGDPMVKDGDGRFSLTLSLDPGDYAYKLYDPLADRWLEDPGNPYFKWVDGERNSRLVVEDCNRPYLRLMHQPESAGGDVTFKVQYVDGASGAGLAAGVQVTRNDVGINTTLDAQTGVVTIADHGLAPGKYAYRFSATDGGGREARLYVPVWVEEQPFAWEDAVLYFAMTDRFANGDPGNDAPVAGIDPKANWEGGDFAGLRQKIEEGYFDDLRVNAIWLSSIDENTAGAWPGDDGRSYAAYHSYWPVSTGWRDDNQLPGVQPVDPHFGTPAELKELVRAAHARGIRILVDFVANHVHEESPLWQQHQSDQPPWFHLPASDCKATNWAEPITCWFASYLPDFEYKNTAVMDTVVDHAIWLVEETDIDGFRLDAVKHMIDDFVLTMRGRLREHLRYSAQRFYLVGETFVGEGESEVNLLKHYIGPRMLDGQFDFPLYWQVTAALLREERDLGALEDMCAWNDGQYGDFAVMSTFLGNHDVPRALSHAAGDIDDLWGNGAKEQGWQTPPALPTTPEPFERLRLAWTFLLTSPGIPLIYYGDEVGLSGAGDPDNRRFMQFGDALAPLQAETLAHVQALAAVRRAHRATRRGARRTLFMASDRLLWVYAMQTPDDVVIVALNRGPERRSQKVDLRDLHLADGLTLRDALGGGGVVVADGAVTLELEGHTSAALVAQ